MNYQITDTTRHVLNLLSQYTSIDSPETDCIESAGQDMPSRHPHGTVHSVYRKTINLSLNGRLIALQAADTPLTPLSMVLDLSQDQMAALPIRPGDLVSVRPDFLEISGQWRFLFGQASVLDPELSSVLSWDQLVLLKTRILSALSCRSVGSFELLISQPDQAESVPFLAVARKHLVNTAQALRDSRWEAAAGTLRRLLGLGAGLTPGGDDFLCGVLAGLILCDRKDHAFGCALRHEIISHLEDTNDISAAFLRCALDGQFSQAVLSLGRLPGPGQIFSAFSAIGHSSGTDTLCGVAYILENRGQLQDG